MSHPPLDDTSDDNEGDSMNRLGNQMPLITGVVCSLGTDRKHLWVAMSVTATIPTYLSRGGPR